MSSSFQELLSPVLPSDTKQASTGPTDHSENELDSIGQLNSPSSFPKWPRILVVAFNTFILLGSVFIIGVLAHSLSTYSGTRGIHFGGSSISWPTELNLRPACMVLAASAMSVSPSLASIVIGLRRPRSLCYSNMEKILALIDSVLLVMWITSDILKGVSERTPKRDLLSWACRRRGSPTNKLVNYTLVCDEQVSAFDPLCLPFC